MPQAVPPSTSSAAVTKSPAKLRNCSTTVSVTILSLENVGYLRDMADPLMADTVIPYQGGRAIVLGCDTGEVFMVREQLAAEMKHAEKMPWPISPLSGLAKKISGKTTAASPA